jgi:hypothetical protein
VSEVVNQQNNLFNSHRFFEFYLPFALAFGQSLDAVGSAA